MGALGIALLTLKDSLTAGDQPKKSTFIGIEGLRDFTYTKQPGVVCTICANLCSRTVVAFLTVSTK